VISCFTRYVNDPVTKQFLNNIKTPNGRFAYLCLSFTPFDKQKLCRMTYDRFLKTIYWFVIREYLIGQNQGKCSHCGFAAHLNVHHSSYDHHGSEHQFLGDLTVLCESCHQKQHVPPGDIESIFKCLALTKKLKILPLYKTNPNYDPRTMLNLKYFGDIRGKQYAE